MGVETAANISRHDIYASSHLLPRTAPDRAGSHSLYACRDSRLRLKGTFEGASSLQIRRLGGLQARDADAGFLLTPQISAPANLSGEPGEIFRDSVDRWARTARHKPQEAGCPSLCPNGGPSASSSSTLRAAPCGPASTRRAGLCYGLRHLQRVTLASALRYHPLFSPPCSA